MTKVDMNIVTKAQMEKYLRKFPEVQNREPSDLFEYYIASMLLEKYAGRSGEVDVDQYIAGHGVQGYDFFAVLVNGVLIKDCIQLQEESEKFREINAEIFFGQMKSNRGVKLGDLSIFLDAVKGAILDPDIEKIDRYPCIEIISELYKHSEKFGKNPRLHCIFAVAGSTSIEEPVAEKIENFKSELADLALTERPTVEVIGEKDVQELYRETTEGLQRTIHLPGRKVIDSIENVDEALVGLLTCDDLIKLITLEEDLPYNERTFAKPVFSENVRAYQGHVEVNSEIRSTLDSSRRTRFPVLNNGITIVAKDLRSTGDRVTLHNYQIVNGCQTAHVIFEYFSDRMADGQVDKEEVVNEAKTLPVVVKLVGTGDAEISREIARATNQQTRVSKESLMANLPIQKRIAAYFESAGSGDTKLYYERRDKEWDGVEIEQGMWRIISVRHMIQSFASCFLRKPHTATRYYSDLRDQAESEVFNEGYAVPFFWASALIYCRLDFLFRNQKISSDIKPIRFHVMVAIARAFYEGNFALKTNDENAGKKLKNLIDSVSNDDILISSAGIAYEKACNMGGKIDRDFCRSTKEAHRFIREASHEIRSRVCVKSVK